MNIHNKQEYRELLTEKQWAKRGRVINANAEGLTMWTNAFCEKQAVYYAKTDTHEANSQELEVFWRQVKDKRNKYSREWRKKKRAETEKMINGYKEEIANLQKLIKEKDSVVDKLRAILADTVKEISILQKKDEEVKQQVIVIDTETTGLFRTDELLQVSIIDEHNTVLYNSHIKPLSAKEWKEAQAVNHISPEMVKDCPDIYSEMHKINNILRTAKTVIGYNTSFDVGFLENFGADFSNVKTYIDVMKEFAPIYGEYDEYHEDYRWQKLMTCAEYYKYDWENDKAHDSLSDCRATLHCYNAMTNE